MIYGALATCAVAVSAVALSEAVGDLFAMALGPISEALEAADRS